MDVFTGLPSGRLVLTFSKAPKPQRTYKNSAAGLRALSESSSEGVKWVPPQVHHGKAASSRPESFCLVEEVSRSRRPTVEGFVCGLLCWHFLAIMSFVVVVAVSLQRIIKHRVWQNRNLQLLFWPTVLFR